MQSWIAFARDVLIVWQIGLVLVLILHSMRLRATERYAVASAALAPIVVAVLALLAVSRSAPGYLDVALVVAMLGAGQTVATSRTVERHEELEQ